MAKLEAKTDELINLVEKLELPLNISKRNDGRITVKIQGMELALPGLELGGINMKIEKLKGLEVDIDSLKISEEDAKVEFAIK